MPLTLECLEATSPDDVAIFYQIYTQEWTASYGSKIDQQGLLNHHVNSGINSRIYLLKVEGEIIGGCEVAFPDENSGFELPCQEYLHDLKPFLDKGILNKLSYCEITKVVIAKAKRSSNYLKQLLSQVVVDVHKLGIDALLSYSTYQHSILYQRVYRTGVIENIDCKVHRDLFNVDIKGSNKEFCLVVYSRC